MLINEVCKECNLTKKAVEYYGEQGLISPTVMENGYRYFTEYDVSKLKRIAILRGLGLSVSDIRAVLEKDNPSIIYDVIHKKELEIADLQEKQALIRQLAEHNDWDTVRIRIDALQKRQSILNRMLDKFPGYYGKMVCSHFSSFLSDPITTDEQQEAFETIIDFLDNVDIVIPEDMQELLDELTRITDTSAIKSVSSALVVAMENPEQYISDHKEVLEQYRAIVTSDEYKATPMYRLQELLKQLQKENGYNDIFIPAMQRLSPSYREYYENLLVANDVFIKHCSDES